MNTFQLAQRLARNMAQPDLGTMPNSGMLDILDAMQSGLQEAWRLLPSPLRTKTFSVVLPAPQNVSVTVSELGANTITTNAFTTAMIGCTVRVNDDPHDNVITGPNTLLDAFTGQNLAGTAQVFGDASNVYDPIERIVGDMRIYRTDGTWYPLIRAEGYRRGGIRYAWWYGYPIPYPTGYNQLRPINRPMIYLLESRAMSNLTASEFYLNFFPMPDTDYTCRYEAEISPPQLAFNSIVDPAQVIDIPVKASLASSCLVPICEEYLLRSPLFGDRKTMASVIQAAAQRARDTLHAHSGDFAHPNNDIGTPWGY